MKHVVRVAKRLVVWMALMCIVQTDRHARASLEFVLCNREDPFVCEPLNCFSPSVFTQPECSEPMASSWVLQKVKDIRHFIGLSCNGFEGQFMALFTAIKTSHNQEGWVSNSKTAFRCNRELKRLSCSINYDSTGGNSSRSRVKGRELMSYSFVLNLWGCSHVDWCCLDSTTLIASCAWYAKTTVRGLIAPNSLLLLT